VVVVCVVFFGADDSVGFIVVSGVVVVGASVSVVGAIVVSVGTWVEGVFSTLTFSTELFM